MGDLEGRMDPKKMSLDDLANAMGMPPGSEPRQTAEAEIARRQMTDQQLVKDAQIAAARAQELAANASVRSANAAERMGRYMLASVVVALVATIVLALSTYFAFQATLLE
jgi:hypothetical protein